MSKNEPPSREPRASSGEAISRGYAYEGGELALFERAVRWKSYFKSRLRPYLRGEVLEVGAGIGATTRCLCDAGARRWVCLEPDRRMADELRGRTAGLPVPVEVLHGTVAELAPERTFDAVLYVDVLEHIEADRDELRAAAAHLAPGGALVVLAPAHGYLFTEFDRAIGHHRRYDRRSLRAIAPDGVVEERVFYLDAAGMLASLGNRLCLRQSMPTAGQLRFWDTWLIPVSRVVDRLLGHRLGKTVVAVWRRP